MTAGYRLINNKIIYSEEIITGDQYTLHGANNTDIITESNDTETTEENSLNRHNVVLTEKDEHNSENHIVFDANTARVTVGSGEDSLLIYNDARAIVDMTNADNVTIVPYSGSVTLEGYDASSGAAILIMNADNIVEAVKDNSVKLVGNRIQFGSDTAVRINNLGDSMIVNLVSEDGAVQKVGFTKISDGELDTSKLEDDFLLKGNYAENFSDNQKRKGSIITAVKVMTLYSPVVEMLLMAAKGKIKFISHLMICVGEKKAQLLFPRTRGEIPFTVSTKALTLTVTLFKSTISIISNSNSRPTDYH